MGMRNLLPPAPRSPPHPAGIMTPMPRLRISWRPLLLVPFLGLCLLATGAASAQTETLPQRFNQILAGHGIVGGAIAVVRAGQPPAEFFYGEARRSTHQPIDADTTYNWASITKTMTAIAILQLRDRGRLSLDDPAVRYIPELRQIHDAFGPIDRVTIRTLPPTAPASAIPHGPG